MTSQYGCVPTYKVFADGEEVFGSILTELTNDNTLDGKVVQYSVTAYGQMTQQEYTRTFTKIYRSSCYDAILNVSAPASSNNYPLYKEFEILFNQATSTMSVSFCGPLEYTLRNAIDGSQMNPSVFQFKDSALSSEKILYGNPSALDLV